MSKRVATVGDAVRYTCRIGDKTYSGVGTIAAGSPDVRCEGAQLARDNDPVNCGPCGTGRIVATAKNRANKKKIARIGDTVRLPTGSGRIISGATRTKSK